jgi:hypothetical protein
MFITIVAIINYEISVVAIAIEKNYDLTFDMNLTGIHAEYGYRKDLISHRDSILLRYESFNI